MSNPSETQDPPFERPELIKMLRENWLNEIVIARTYARLADLESDTNRKRLLNMMAENEETHAQMWAERLKDVGGTLPADREVEREVRKQERLARWFGTDAALRRIEKEERGHVVSYTAQTQSVGDEKSNRILTEIIPDEVAHADRLKAMSDPRNAPRGVLDRMLAAEKWHTAHTGGWLGDAIYGANDGLGAVFGTISTVAGATSNDPHKGHAVLLAGIAVMLASALSMGAGAYLATKAETEVHDAEIGRERREIEESPEHERIELELMYQLKGFTEEEAKMLSARITADPEQFLRTMASEELGLSMQSRANPFTAALSGSLSTAVGAFVPLVPFFFLHGTLAVIWAGIISLAAHFAVGAAKTFVTGRSWVASGTEMTVVGIMLAVVTYVIGLAIGGSVGG